MIKPEFWSDEKTGMLSPFDKCLFIGIWNYSDDEGLIRANPMYLKASIFPYDADVSINEISESLKRLSDLELIFQYKQNNQQYLWVIKFRVHQRIDKPQKPQNPAPSIQNNSYKDSIFRRDGYICYLCGEFTDISDDLNKVGSKFPSIDHIKPKSKGGSDYPTNLKTACISCNKSKQNKDIPRTFQEHSKKGIEQKKRKEVKLKENNNNPSGCLSDNQFLETAKRYLTYPGYTEKDFVSHCTAFGKNPDEVRKLI
jgi:5-methylcytosine-specific restriction endonuclease McrA